MEGCLRKFSSVQLLSRVWLCDSMNCYGNRIDTSCIVSIINRDADNISQMREEKKHLYYELKRIKENLYSPHLVLILKLK